MTKPADSKDNKDKLRVYEYAKSLNMSSKEIITILKKLELPVNNHMSVMENEMVGKVEGFFKNIKDGAAAKLAKNSNVTISAAAPEVTRTEDRKQQQQGVHNIQTQQPSNNNNQQEKQVTMTTSNSQQDNTKVENTPTVAQNTAPAQASRQGEGARTGNRPQGSGTGSRPQGQGNRPQGSRNRSRPQGQGSRPQGSGTGSRPPGQGSRPGGQGNGGASRPQGQGTSRPPQGAGSRPQGQGEQRVAAAVQVVQVNAAPTQELLPVLSQTISQRQQVVQAETATTTAMRVDQESVSQVAMTVLMTKAVSATTEAVKTIAVAVIRSSLHVKKLTTHLKRSLFAVICPLVI